MLPVVFAGLLAAFWRRCRERQLAAAAHASVTPLAACKLLIELLVYLQQHRGMSSAWLSGDTSFFLRRQEKQARIAELFPALALLARRESGQGVSCLTSEQLSLFVFRWQCLLEELSHLNPEQAIARHNQSIARVLEWLVALGERRIEPSATDTASIGVARNFTYRLPLLTECLGQARAIGSSVAARRICPPVARVRLMFLVGRAEALLEQAMLAHNAGQASLQSRQAIAIMATTVRTRMLLSRGVVVNASEYFALTTRAIDAVFQWIDVCAAEIERFPAARVLPVLPPESA